jgi:hypothetical protein
MIVGHKWIPVEYRCECGLGPTAFPTRHAEICWYLEHMESLSGDKPVTKIRTRSGAEYTIDLETKTWERVPGVESSWIRTQSGEFTSISPIKIGHSVTMTCPPITEGAIGRLIVTTEVVCVEE